jgi:DNA-binding protein H-NS
MSDFKTRLLDEKAQLDERLEKLQAFQASDGFQNIAAVQQTLLNVQANAMATYSQILLERIAWLEPVGASQA